MHPARLFVLCGLPGSGTTTRAVELEERFDAVRMSADDWMGRLGTDIWDDAVRARIEVIQRDLAMPVLLAGTDVVIEWGTWARSERDELRALARRAGALAHLEFLDAPLDELWDRVRTRGHEQSVGSRTITRDDLAAWSTIIERPTANELHTYDPMPPVRSGERPGSPAYPYGSWRP